MTRKPFEPHILVMDQLPVEWEKLLTVRGYRTTLLREIDHLFRLLQDPLFQFDLLIVNTSIFDDAFPQTAKKGLQDLKRLLRKRRNAVLFLKSPSLKDNASSPQFLDYKTVIHWVDQVDRVLGQRLLSNPVERNISWRAPQRIGVKTQMNPWNRFGQANPLTMREREILGLLAQGLSNREIAEYLVLSELTVKTHLKNVFKKLQVTSRTQAIAKGIQNHWLPA